ncbi:hypothetical protein HDK90DRAFT_491921, partial [Phyllosticta capitalensis]
LLACLLACFLAVGRWRTEALRGTAWPRLGRQSSLVRSTVLYDFSGQTHVGDEADWSIAKDGPLAHCIPCVSRYCSVHHQA